MIYSASRFLIRTRAPNKGGINILSQPDVYSTIFHFSPPLSWNIDNFFLKKPPVHGISSAGVVRQTHIFNSKIVKLKKKKIFCMLSNMQHGPEGSRDDHTLLRYTKTDIRMKVFFFWGSSLQRYTHTKMYIIKCPPSIPSGPVRGFCEVFKMRGEEMKWGPGSSPWTYYQDAIRTTMGYYKLADTLKIFFSL